MPEKFPQLNPEKEEVIIRHPEPIKIPKRFMQPIKKATPKVETKAATEPFDKPRLSYEREKHVFDKILDSPKNPERKTSDSGVETFIKEPATKTAKLFRKGVEVIIEKPVKKVFAGVWEGITKKTPIAKPVEESKSTTLSPEKDKIDKALDVLEEVEKKIMKEGLWKSLSDGLNKVLSKGAEVFIKRPIRTIFSGKTQKQSPEKYEKAEFEKMERPKDSTLETEDENMMDLSLPGVTKKELFVEKPTSPLIRIKKKK